MAKSARFLVDPKLASLLGEGYRSSEYALKELIDNAWDADAMHVKVTLPEVVSGGPIIVEDDGTGMTEAEVRSDYLAIASDRLSRKGDRTAGRNRVVKGRKGIGKFAGLMAADTMTIETRCRGVATHLVIRREDLQAGAGDLEAIDLPVHTAPCDTGAHGTTVTLSHLSQTFDPPTAPRLRQILMLEYGRQADFGILVNADSVGVEDIPGEGFELTGDLPDIGPVALRFTVSLDRKALRQSGIAVRVTSRVIGRPTVFGLEEDPEIPSKLLKRVYGELEADGLARDITADWSAVIENSIAYATVSAWARGHLKTALSRVYAQEVQLARGRLTQEQTRRLATIPEFRRPIVEKVIVKTLERLYDDKPERVGPIVDLMLEAFDHDAYFSVVQAVTEAQASDVATFATALGEFGLADMAMMAGQATRRLEMLDKLDALLMDPKTLERDMHVALERNLWVFGSEYALLSSNQTLRRMIEQYAHVTYTGSRAAERPDLLLLNDVTGRYRLIEFKRPSMDITRTHEAQAANYRDDLIKQFSRTIEVLIIGRGVAEGMDLDYAPSTLTVTSYAKVVADARAQLNWLLEQLTSETAVDAPNAA